MPIEALTDRRLRGLQHSDGEVIDRRTGLIARADKAGRVSFSFRYRTAGARRRIVLGRFPAVALADARIAAGRIRERLREGHDPAQERHDSRAAPVGLTVDALADLFLERHSMKFKSSWKSDCRYLRADVRPHWGARQAASITKADVAKLLFDVAARAPVSANRLRALLAKMFGWAADAALLDNNPALGVKRPTPESRGRERVLSNPEICLLWRALETAEVPSGIVAAFRLMLLLGSRSGEILGMTEGELHQLDDERAAFWQIPAQRMKARRVHVMPLLGVARSIVLTELARPRASEFIFSSGRARPDRNVLSRTLGQIINRLGEDATSLKNARPTPHDLRRSVISGMARIGIARDHRMAIAAHSYSDSHATYDRHDYLDEKRSALRKWQAHLRKVIAGEPAGGAEIVALPTAARVR